MRLKILFCLLFLVLVLDPTNGSNEINSDSVNTGESEDEFDEESVEEQPVETTTIGEASEEFISDDSDELELIPETARKVNEEQIENTLDGTDDDDEQENSEFGTMVNNGNRIDPVLNGEEILRAERVVPEKIAANDVKNIPVDLSDEDESDEEWANFGETFTTTQIDSDTLNFMGEKSVKLQRDESNERDSSKRLENAVSNYVDNVLERIEQWQSELNQSISTVSSNIFDLTAERIRLESNSKASTSTSKSSENEYLADRFRKFLTARRQIMSLIDRENLQKDFWKQMKNCSALFSEFVQHCREMRADQREDLKNFTDFILIIEKIENFLPILRTDPKSNQSIVENEKILNELNVDVQNFIVSSI